MTYAEKPRDPRWMEFRNGYIRRLRNRIEHDRDIYCESCGEEANCYQLHHRVYFDGHEAWEYEDEHLLLVCEECHDRIHAVEKLTRAWILSIEPHVLYEFRQFMEELIECPNPKVACAQSKNVVRNLTLKESAPWPDDIMKVFGGKE